MPPLETVDLTDDAMLSMATGVAEDSEKTFAPRVAIKCRWVDRRSDNRDPFRHTISSDAWIASDRALTIGSVVTKGKAGSPESEPMEVVRDAEAKDIKGQNSRFEYFLGRYKDTAPS